MGSHRVQPCAEVRMRRAWREFLRGIHEATTLTRDDFALMPPPLEAQPTVLWSPDTPTMPAGHVWTLPGVGPSKLDRALWWSEPGNLRDNATVACLANARLYEPIPGWKPPTPTRVRIFDRDGALIGESGEPELITSQSAEDQRAHEEDADD